MSIRLSTRTAGSFNVQWLAVFNRNRWSPSVGAGRLPVSLIGNTWRTPKLWKIMVGDPPLFPFYYLYHQ